MESSQCTFLRQNHSLVSHHRDYIERCDQTGFYSLLLLRMVGESGCGKIGALHRRFLFRLPGCAVAVAKAKRRLRKPSRFRSRKRSHSDGPVAVRRGEWSSLRVLPNHEPRGRGRCPPILQLLELRRTPAWDPHFLSTWVPTAAPLPARHARGFFQRMGMSLGSDVQRSYLFDAQSSPGAGECDNTTLFEGNAGFSDYAGGLLLGDEPNRPRSEDFLSEERANDSTGYRNLSGVPSDAWDYALPRRLNNRIAEVSQGAARTLPRFLEHVVSAGEIGGRGGRLRGRAAVEKIVRDGFANLHARAPPRQKPHWEHCAKFRGVRPIYHASRNRPPHISITSITRSA